ncbi:hypothetical protein Bca4012_042522 [Brassica carinata]
MTFIVTVTNPQVEMVSLLQTTTWLLRSGNMMKDDYGSDMRKRYLQRNTPQALRNQIIS